MAFEETVENVQFFFNFDLHVKMEQFDWSNGLHLICNSFVFFGISAIIVISQTLYGVEVMNANVLMIWLQINSCHVFQSFAYSG